MLTEFQAAELYKCMDREIVATAAAIQARDETPSDEEYKRRAKDAVYRGYLAWHATTKILRGTGSKADGRESRAGVAGEAPPRRTEGDSDPSGPSSLAEWREECNWHG